jgi:para-aminobenzoate synthetase component 1
MNILCIFGLMDRKQFSYGKRESIDLINRMGDKGEAFCFLISFDMEQNIILPADRAAENGFHLQMPGLPVNGAFAPLRSEKGIDKDGREISLRKFPVDNDRFRKAFEYVRREILYGNSFLLNLTFPTRIQTNLSLREIYQQSQAPYKLFIEDTLVIFSPERFVRIHGTSIHSNPMKGTMDAGIPGAFSRLSSDVKEDAEHHTIVDLIRNDLSMVAENVRVRRFKYIEKVRTHQGELLQMSSEIHGILPDGFQKRLGEILFTLLPAGSVSGAPKKKTVEIIRKAEQYERGYYTGIFGYWDGYTLESAVAIRFIERHEEDLLFKSGGGITFQSDCDEEYKEMIRKVYVPIY